MNLKKSILTMALMELTFSSYAAVEQMNVCLASHTSQSSPSFMKADPPKVHLNVKRNNLGVSYPKSPILIPELIMDGHTLHFVTPCTGLTLRLVHDDEVCCETVITSDNVEIPSALTGVYELQILRGDYIFFAEVEL